MRRAMNASGRMEAARRLERVESDRRRSAFFWGAALILVTLAAYLPALGCGFIWDDDRYVTQNPTLIGLKGLLRIWTELGATDQYYPLVFSTFWLERIFWGNHPLGYHAVNIALHAANAIFFWRLLIWLNVPGAWIAAAIFAVHPVHVESVAWITERKNTLSLFFYLPAGFAYLRFAGIGGAALSRSWKWYFIAVALLVAALLSKTVTVTFPAAMLLILWWKRPRLAISDVLPLIPLLCICLAAGGITWWVEARHVGADEWHAPFLSRLLVAGQAFWFYLGKLLWPGTLVFVYPRWFSEAASPKSVLNVFLILTMLAALWALRGKIGKGPLIAVLFFGGSLMPMLGFINIFAMRYSYVADHFQYLPSLGILALFGAAVSRLFSAASTSGRPFLTRRLVIAASLLLVSALSYKTWRQCDDYRNEEALWQATIAKNPAAWMAHNNLANIRQREGRLVDARKSFESAIRLRPELFEAHYNLANVLATLNDAAASETHYREALRLRDDLVDGRFNYGILLAKQSRHGEAAEQFERVLRLSPSDRAAHFNLGAAYSELGRHDEAIGHLREAVRLRPDSAPLHARLAQAFGAKGDWAKAEHEYRESQRLKPDSADTVEGLAVSLEMLGRIGEAVTEYRRALSMDAGRQIAAQHLALLTGSSSTTKPGP